MNDNDSNEFEREYNVEIYGMNDDETNASETVLPYDSVRFDDMQVLSGPETNSNQQEHAEQSTLVYQTVDDCFEYEYIKFEHN